jgi:hypothetical protein
LAKGMLFFKIKGDMNKILIICLLLLLKTSFCLSQIKGKCIDDLGKPLSYVNVGIKNTTIGTVTDTEGNFNINNNLSDSATLIISHIGYVTQSIEAQKISNLQIVMKAEVYELAEINVVSIPYKYTDEKKIGNNVLSKNVVVAFSSMNLGAEIGKYFKVKKGKRYKVKKVHFNITNLGYKKGTFRINFYNATDEDTIESERINPNDIIMEVSSIGDVDVDVSNENLVFENGFLVTIEGIDYIENAEAITKEQRRVYFSSNVYCGPIYLRPNKLTKWKPKKQKFDVGLGMQLIVKY